MSAEHQAKCPLYKAHFRLPRASCSRPCQTHSQIHLLGGAPGAGDTPQTVAHVCRQCKQAAGRQHKAGKAVVVGAAGPQPSPFLEVAIKSLQK